MSDKNLIEYLRRRCEGEAADRLEKHMAVAEAARKCKNGCRRCNAFDRYAVLKDALAALDEET